MLTFAIWLLSAVPLIPHCAPTVFVDQLEAGQARVISTDPGSGAAWDMRADYLPSGTEEGNTVHLCGYFRYADDGIEGTPEGDTAVKAEEQRARMGASDPGGTIDLTNPQTFNGGPVPAQRRGL